MTAVLSSWTSLQCMFMHINGQCSSHADCLLKISTYLLFLFNLGKAVVESIGQSSRGSVSSWEASKGKFGHFYHIFPSVVNCQKCQLVLFSVGCTPTALIKEVFRSLKQWDQVTAKGFFAKTRGLVDGNFFHIRIHLTSPSINLFLCLRKSSVWGGHLWA